jgi:hypothetical protein
VAFHELLTALRKRWYLAGAAALCVLAAGLYVLHGKPLYQASAAVVLVPPKAPSVQNRLASATPSIAAAGLAVDDILLSPAEQSALRAQGVVDAYTIVPRNNGTNETPAYRVPSEQITVTGGDVEAVLAEAGTLMDDYAARLRSMQSGAGVAVQAQITDGVLAPPTAVRLHGSRSRGVVAVSLLALGAAIVVAARFRPRRARSASLAGSGDREGLAGGDGLGGLSGFSGVGGDERVRSNESERAEDADAVVA